MTERLLRKKELADILGTSPDVAASIMAKRGVYPIDWGVGRYRGLRWPESLVKQAIAAMIDETRPKPKKPLVPRPNVPRISLANMSPADVYNLTTGRRVQ